MVIGVYGIIGSGKSEVAGIFSEIYDFKVIDADSIGHRALDLPDVREKLVKEFGSVILKGDTTTEIDKNILGNIIFSNKRRKEKLENIIWPYIKEFIEKETNKGDRILIDAAVLFSAGWNKLCDYTIYVYTPLPLIFLRVYRKKKYSLIRIFHIIRSQEEVLRDSVKATFKIYNNSNAKDLNKKIGCIWKKISH